MLAIERAVDFAIDGNISKIAIMTDSLAGIYSVSADCHTNYIARRIRSKIRDSDIDKVEIHYIPGHSGINGNEIVDVAAKDAHLLGTRIDVRWPLSDALRYIESTLRTEWQNDYDEIRVNKGTYYGSLFPMIKDKPWFSDLEIDLDKVKPSDIRLANRLLSGHALCGYTLAKMNIIATSNCNSCGCVEDVSHIIFNCTKFASERSKFTKISKYSGLREFVLGEGLSSIFTLTDFLKGIDSIL